MFGWHARFHKDSYQKWCPGEAQLINLRSSVEGNFVREAKDYASRTKFPSTEDRKWTVFQLNQCSWPSSQCIFFAWGKSLFSTRSHQYTPLVSPHSPHDCYQKTSHLEKDYKMKALPCFVSSHNKKIIMNFYQCCQPLRCSSVVCQCLTNLRLQYR